MQLVSSHHNTAQTSDGIALSTMSPGNVSGIKFIVSSVEKIGHDLSEFSDSLSTKK